MKQMVKPMANILSDYEVELSFTPPPQQGRLLNGVITKKIRINSGEFVYEVKVNNRGGTYTIKGVKETISGFYGPEPGKLSVNTSVLIQKTGRSSWEIVRVESNPDDFEGESYPPTTILTGDEPGEDEEESSLLTISQQKMLLAYAKQLENRLLYNTLLLDDRGLILEAHISPVDHSDNNSIGLGILANGTLLLSRYINSFNSINSNAKVAAIRNGQPTTIRFNIVNGRDSNGGVVTGSVDVNIESFGIRPIETFLVGDTET